MHSHLIHIVRWLFPFSQGLGFGVIAMLLHEGGHLFAALVLGLRIKSVGMKWNKGLYTIREQGTPLQNLLVALRGPAHQPSSPRRRISSSTLWTREFLLRPGQHASH
jgi:hypothetical protein